MLVSILVPLGLVFDVIEFFPMAAVILLVSIAVDIGCCWVAATRAKPSSLGRIGTVSGRCVLQLRQAVTQTSIVAA